MKLTIIVPVFNTEKYVRKCIQSIIEQDGGLFREVELIIVNDGTKDKSIEAIEDLIHRHTNIILIDKNNEGLSAARNDGIRRAKGDYIWFIDSDDWIRADALQAIFPLLDFKNDLIRIYGINHTDCGDQYPLIPFKDICSFSGRESFFHNVAKIATSVLFIYRREFLIQNDLYFMPGVFHEDNEFCPRASYLSKRTAVLPNHLYFIRRTSNDGHISITSSANSKRSFDLLKCMYSLNQFNTSTVAEPRIRKIINEWIGQGLTMAIENIAACGRDEVQRFNLEYYSNFSSLTKCLLHAKAKNKIEGLLFSLFPKNIVRSYMFLNFFNPKKRKIQKK